MEQITNPLIAGLVGALVKELQKQEGVEGVRMQTYRAILERLPNVTILPKEEQVPDSLLEGFLVLEDPYVAGENTIGTFKFQSSGRATFNWVCQHRRKISPPVSWEECFEKIIATIARGLEIPEDLKKRVCELITSGGNGRQPDVETDI